MPGEDTLLHTQARGLTIILSLPGTDDEAGAAYDMHNAVECTRVAQSATNIDCPCQI